jgi:hypothetical protein
MPKLVTLQNPDGTLVAINAEHVVRVSEDPANSNVTRLTLIDREGWTPVAGRFAAIVKLLNGE